MYYTLYVYLMHLIICSVADPGFDHRDWGVAFLKGGGRELTIIESGNV